MSHKHIVSHAFRVWVPVAVAIVVGGGLVYGAVQQNYRSAANDPQVQVAEDIQSALVQGVASPETIAPTPPTVDINASLSPFVVMFSATGTPLGASVALEGKLPTISQGILEHANGKTDYRFTWQPKSGLRIAAVVRKFDGKESAYILVGRSLREVQNRINQLAIMVGAFTAAGLILSFGSFYLIAKKEHGHGHAESKEEELV